MMKQHSDKFNVRNVPKDRYANAGLPKEARGGRSNARIGLSTERLEMLSAEIRSEIQERWKSIVTLVMGCGNYQELRTAWKREEEEGVHM